MRTALLPATALAAAIYQGVFAQVSLTPTRAPFLTSDQLTAVVGDDSAAATIVSEALTYYLHVFPNKAVTLIGAQISENWLPKLPGVRFIRLTDDAARAHLQQCGRLLFVNSFKLLTSDAATIAIAEGNRCTVGGSDLRFNRSADGWHLETGVLPGGFVSGGSDCPCK
jgi:hypothetical protein